MARSNRAEAAFAAFLDLGPDRSLVALHRALRADPAQHGFKRAPALRTLEGWSAREGWGAHIATIERQAREAEERAHVERLLDCLLATLRDAVPYDPERRAQSLTRGAAA